MSNPTFMDTIATRNTAFQLAVDTHPLRFNVEEKPTVEDLIDRAGKIEAYLREGVRD